MPQSRGPSRSRTPSTSRSFVDAFHALFTPQRRCSLRILRMEPVLLADGSPDRCCGHAPHRTRSACTRRADRVRVTRAIRSRSPFHARLRGVDRRHIETHTHALGPCRPCRRLLHAGVARCGRGDHFPSAPHRRLHRRHIHFGIRRFGAGHHPAARLIRSTHPSECTHPTDLLDRTSRRSVRCRFAGRARVRRGWRF